MQIQFLRMWVVAECTEREKKKKKNITISFTLNFKCICVYLYGCFGKRYRNRKAKKDERLCTKRKLKETTTTKIICEMTKRKQFSSRTILQNTIAHKVFWTEVKQKNIHNFCERKEKWMIAIGWVFLFIG